MTNNHSQIIFDFSRETSLKNWQVLDDVVMGGVSEGKISINEEGHGLYEGNVSLENNGGFSSLRYDCGQIETSKGRVIMLRIKGDAKEYQLRIKDKKIHSYSYIFPFKTTGEWETISIALKDMYPTFRGKKLALPKFDESSFEELAILIGNGKNETFQLVIDKITLE